MAKRILIVEDDPDIAHLVARYLTKAGFVTEHIASGREAMQVVTARTPDLMVLDLLLPHVDALEICPRVRADASTAAIPIIMLTARAEESERIVGLELGADDYLAKPLSPNELVARVRALLRRAVRVAARARARRARPARHAPDKTARLRADLRRHRAPPRLLGRPRRHP